MNPRLAGALVLFISACQGAPAPVAPEADAPPPVRREENAVSPRLPAECALFLAQLDCWLRKTGNEPEQVDIALSTVRASFESRPAGAPVDDVVARCERATSGTSLALEAIDCENVHVDPSGLPALDPVVCPPGEHYFIRRDGWIAGCHADCATTADCPKGSTCSSIGSAPGGPIEDAFCE